MLRLIDVSLVRGVRVLYSHASVLASDGERVGLVGPNGCGKSTLFAAILGELQTEAGEIEHPAEDRIAHVAQDIEAVDMSALDFVLSGHAPLEAAKAALKAAEGSGDDMALAQAMATLAELNEGAIAANAKTILHGLGFSEEQTVLPVRDFSGGWRNRLALARALMRPADLLLLDEPTNHLDLEMTEWLEEYLAHTRLSLLMVTHDRYFLDRVCSDIVEIDDRQAYVYHGNYSLYLEKRQQRLDAADAQRERDNNLYRTELEWIRRQPQARGTKARSRVESFGELEERLRKRRESGDVRLDVKAAYIGKKIFEVRGLSKRFGDKVILDGFDYRFARYEKMGIVGDNGTGKSTFIKMLMGLVQPDAGTIDIGETVRFGYYSQDGLSFDDGAKVIDVVTEIAEHIELGEGRRLSASQFLQYFLFTAQTQYDYVEKLSGGERRRLYLCTVLMRNPNFLVLDEPTNDLDIMTLQVLEEFLQGYGGCLIVISHDRYFMDKVADHLLVFQGGGQIKDFPGNYSDYLEWKRLKESEERAAGSRENKKIQEKQMPKQSSAPSGKRKRTYQENREMERLEQEIPQLEQEKAELERLLGSGSLSVGELTAKSVRIGEVIALIDEKSMRWLELSEIAG